MVFTRSAAATSLLQAEELKKGVDNTFLTNSSNDASFKTKLLKDWEAEGKPALGGASLTICYIRGVKVMHAPHKAGDPSSKNAGLGDVLFDAATLALQVYPDTMHFGISIFPKDHNNDKHPSILIPSHLFFQMACKKDLEPDAEGNTKGVILLVTRCSVDQKLTARPNKFAFIMGTKDVEEVETQAKAAHKKHHWGDLLPLGLFPVHSAWVPRHTYLNKTKQYEHAAKALRRHSSK